MRSEIESILISPEAYEKVMNRLNHPKKPAKKLVKAMKSYSAWKYRI